MSVDFDAIPGARPEEPAGRLGLPADRRTRHAPPLEDAGAAAVVLPSLFEEQIVHDELEIVRLLRIRQRRASPRRSAYFPELDDYNTGPGRVPAARSRRPSRRSTIPIIGSLNGTSTGGWVRYAKMIEEAGADALELNIYLVATDPDDHRRRKSRASYLELVAAVREVVSIPLAVKIGPFFSSLPNMARRLVACRGRRPGAVQSLPPARHRPRDPDRRAPTWC